MKLTEYVISLSNGKQFEICVENNAAFNIDDAIISWSARTNKYTASSFRDYIKSKGFTAMTKSEYSKLLLQTKK